MPTIPWREYCRKYAPRWVRHGHAKIRKIRQHSIENPGRSPSLRERLQSPWLVAGQYLYNLAVAILIAWLFANQYNFSEYLNGAGERRDLERELSRDRLCALIYALQEDLSADLSRISEEAGCEPNTPFQQDGGTAPGEVPADVTPGPSSIPVPSTGSGGG